MKSTHHLGGGGGGVEEVSTLRQENNLMTRFDYFERKTDNLECRSELSNLIFFGLPRREIKMGVECEAMLTVTDLITDKLELPDNIEFYHVHRLSATPSRTLL